MSTHTWITEQGINELNIRLKSKQHDIITKYLLEVANTGSKGLRDSEVIPWRDPDAIMQTCEDRRWTTWERGKEPVYDKFIVSWPGDPRRKKIHEKG